MNGDILVSLPAGMAPPVDCAALVIRSGRVEDLVSACRALGDRVCGLELHGAGHNVAPLACLPSGMPLLWKFPVSEAADIFAHTWLAEHFDLGVMMDASTGIFDAVKIVTSAEVPVVLCLDGAIDCPALMSLLDYYLHSKYLQVPVEFFHSMFALLVRGVNVSLADLYLENPVQALHVDEHGRITASSRFALAGRSFGSMNDGFSVDRESPFYRFLQDPGKALHLTGSSCCWCESFDLCGGHLRFVDPDFDCIPFQGLFKAIKGAAAEIVDDLSNL